MRGLATSLLLVVLLATLGAGWALDRLFGRLAEAEPTPLALYRELGGRYAAAVDGQFKASAEGQIEGQVDGSVAGQVAGQVEGSVDGLIAGQLDGPLVRLSSGGLLEDRVSILPSTALALNQPLAAELESLQGLALETAAGVTLYYALPARDALMAIDYPLAGEKLPTLRLVLTLAFYVALVLLTLTWLLPLLRRLATLATAARALGDGDLAQRVKARSAGEIRDVEVAFNEMAARIENLVEDNRLLSRAVSHDLKTPLARLRFGIDTLAEHSDISPAQRRHLTRIESDIDAMERLVEVLLDYARFDARLSRLPRTRFELSEAVGSSVERCLPADRLTVDWRPAEKAALIKGHAAQFAMLTDNLLENACQHAFSEIRVSIEVEQGVARLHVEDDGPGIALADRERLVQPFQRGAVAVTPPGGRARQGGHGLGLAIVARLAAWHRGELSIDTSAALGGARLVVAFNLVT